MTGSTIDYSNKIQYEAQKLVKSVIADNEELPIEERNQLRHDWAVQLTAITGCTLKTARQHVATALRRQRAPDWSGPEERYHDNKRGGKREGAGRPAAAEFKISIQIPHQRGEWRLEAQTARGFKLLHSAPATGGIYETMLKPSFFREIAWAEDGTRMMKIWKLNHHGEIVVMKEWSDD